MIRRTLISRPTVDTLITALLAEVEEEAAVVPDHQEEADTTPQAARAVRPRTPAAALPRFTITLPHILDPHLPALTLLTA